MRKFTDRPTLSLFARNGKTTADFLLEFVFWREHTVYKIPSGQHERDQRPGVLVDEAV